MGGAGCGTCHDLTPVTGDGSRIGSAANGDGGDGLFDCTDCHIGYYDEHKHGKPGFPEHNLGTVALCLNCHTASTIPFIGSGEVHAANGCNNCHDLDVKNDGSLRGSASGHGIGSNCQDCHTGYFNGHGHDHKSTVIVNTSTASTTENCTGCHTGAVAGDGPFTSSVHYRGCVTCHSTIDGSLLNVAGRANAGAPTDGIMADGKRECGECHALYYEAHKHGDEAFEPNHALDIGSSTSGGQPCSNCHPGVDT